MTKLYTKLDLSSKIGLRPKS